MTSAPVWCPMLLAFIPHHAWLSYPGIVTQDNTWSFWALNTPPPRGSHCTPVCSYCPLTLYCGAQDQRTELPHPQSPTSSCQEGDQREMVFFEKNPPSPSLVFTSQATQGCLEYPALFLQRDEPCPLLDKKWSGSSFIPVVLSSGSVPSGLLPELQGNLCL